LWPLRAPGPPPPLPSPPLPPTKAPSPVARREDDASNVPNEEAGLVTWWDEQTEGSPAAASKAQWSL